VEQVCTAVYAPSLLLASTGAAAIRHFDCPRCSALGQTAVPCFACSAAEQLAVETALELPNLYYMGIEQISLNTFVWLDGSFIGNTTPSNSNPYRHWSPQVYAQLQANPTFTCFVSYTANMYSTFIGNASMWTHISGWSSAYYNTTRPTWASWYNYAACTTAYAAVCEQPLATYACAGYPPPSSSAPVAAGSACKCSRR
jgi:hypothetical protein